MSDYVIHRKKQQILEHLKSSVWGSMTCQRIATALNMPYDKVMTELIALKRENKVKSSRNGLLVVYSII